MKQANKPTPFTGSKVPPPPMLPRSLLLALACAALAPAQPADEAGRFIITNFLPRDYKRHAQVWSAAQTADGLLYFGNRGGVLEYDGRSWGLIEVPGSFVHRVALAPDGHLYVSGHDLLGRLEKNARGRFAFRSLLDRVPEEAKPLGPVSSNVIHDGAVFFGSTSYVLRSLKGLRASL